MDEKMLAKMARTYRDAAEKTDLPKTEIALVVLDLPANSLPQAIADIVGGKTGLTGPRRRARQART